MSGTGRGFPLSAVGRGVTGPARPAFSIALAACALLMFAGPAPGQEKAPAAEGASVQRAAVRWKEILTEGNVTRIRLEASSLPRYEISTSEKPPTVDVNLLEVEFGGLPAHLNVGDGTIESVETRTLPGGVGRITLLLSGPGDAAVVPWSGGLDLLVHLRGSEPQATPAKTEHAPIARRLSGEAGQNGLSFALGAVPSSLSAFLLSDGKRLVVDAEGVDLPSSQVLEDFAEGPLARVRIARQDGRIRIVVEGREVGVFDGHRLEKTGDGFSLLLAGAPAGGKAEAALQGEQKPETPPPSAGKASTPEPEAKGGGEVTSFGFRQEAGRSLVEAVLSKPALHVVREASGKRVVVDLLRTALPDKFRRALDTSAFSGPVRTVAAYPRGGAAGKPVDTRIVVDLRRPAPYRVERQGSRITLVFEGSPEEPAVQGVAEVRKAGEEVVIVEGKPAKADKPAKVEASEKPSKASGAAPQAAYTGRRLSMDFMDADIRNVLRLIGEVSGLNMVTGDDVQGKVTIRLVDVPWDQALEVILKTKALDQVKEGNVIRIAPADKLAAEKARVREAEKGAEEKAPLMSDILPVNYATAKELADKVKAVLTPRGSVAVDERTNAILIKDVAEKVDEARKLVARLDTQTPQVLIEARIVEVSSTYSKDLGVQWGGQFTADTAHGNATDWAFPNSVGVTGGMAGSNGINNFAVNFPAAVGPTGGGALAFSLGHINDILSLDLRLSALESSGRGRVVSSPRVSTLDNRAAEIKQGVSIPFTTSTQEKIETQSIDYLLSLNVTPHVTADRSIIMKIDVKKDAPSTTFVAVDTKTPAKETRSATTEVLVKDGETTVIGGIITDSQGTNERGVPYLSKIPFLGWLFKGKTDSIQKTELVIFITPKIINAATVAGSP